MYITNDLKRRVYEHKEKLVKGFTKKYDITKFVYYEVFEGHSECYFERETDQGWFKAEEISLEEYKKGYREVVSEEEKRDFSAHLVVYVLVNIMLIAINLIYSPGDIWFFYPLIGWGIGISMHYLFGVRWIQKGLEEREAKAEYRVKEIKSK